MRLRICQQPTGIIDGIALDQFHAGLVYDFGAHLADMLLAKGVGHTRAAVVLVVDDQADLRELTSTVLTCDGYTVIQAPDGRDAMASLCEHAPDLVVLDLEMPVMDGWQFCAEQHKLIDGRLAAIPVLLVTGSDNADVHASTLAAVGLVKKPFGPRQLLDAVDLALRH